MKVLAIDIEIAPYKGWLNLEIIHDSMIESEDATKHMFNGYHCVLLSDRRFFEEGKEQLIAQVLNIRRVAKKIPLIIILTAKPKTPSGMDLIVRLLKAGADDIMYLPIDKLELQARIVAVTRRTHGFYTNPISIRGVSIDLITGDFRINNSPVHLTPSQFKILESLMLFHHREFSKEELVELTNSKTTSEKIIDVYLAKLRAILKKGGVEDLIHTRWGKGLVIPFPPD